MELKLFGKKVFEFRTAKGARFVQNSLESLEKSKFLPDFYTFRAQGEWSEQYITFDSPLGISIPPNGKKTKKVAKPTKPEKAPTTPKELHELKLLNDENFKLNCDKDYIDSQLKQFEDKLNLIQINEFDISRGTNEIASILVRLKNRKEYKKHEEFYSQFAYTTPSKIADVLQKYGHLQLGQAAHFVADMPADATQVMKDYSAATNKLCGKSAVFYLIADKKDFKKTQQRRDPILLAQSPFGHFWQILGAWDKEMLLLEEL